MPFHPCPTTANYVPIHVANKFARNSPRREWHRRDFIELRLIPPFTQQLEGARLLSHRPKIWKFTSPRITYYTSSTKAQVTTSDYEGNSPIFTRLINYYLGYSCERKLEQIVEL